MSTVALPVVDTDACVVAPRVFLVIGADGVLLAAKHIKLLRWTVLGLLRWVSASVSRDADTIAGEMRRAAHGGR